MQKIHQLSAAQAQKIAAGEVVERPANIVKELLENAVDADATKISVYIVDGGKTSIRVIDDGCGMSIEDARICFNQYATSKITHVDELIHLTTFGFRGEALASIAAVSTVTLRTKEADAPHGYSITMTDGILTHEEVAATNDGTDITVTHLFATIPARKKFLKTHETETRQIEQLICAMALTHLAIEYKLYVDGTLRYNCAPAAHLADRYAQLFDHTTSKHMLSIQHNHDGMQIHGLISHQQYQRYDRSGIYLFVNRRWIKDLNLTRAIMRGYHHVLQPARFPAAVICLELDTQLIDINTHPRKEEVRFMHPRLAEQAVQRTISDRLQESASHILQPEQPQQTMPTALQAAPASVTIPVQKSRTDFFTTPFWKTSPVAAPADTVHNFPQVHELSVAPTYAQQTIATHTPSLQTEHEQSVQIIGQLYQTYIITEQPDMLVLVDQHAAHERILYAQLQQATADVEAIPLLFPLVVQLHHGQLVYLEPYLEQLALYGIHATPIGVDCLHITALAVLFKEKPVDRCIQEIAGWIAEHQHITPTEMASALHDAMRQRMACAAAVKGGDILNHEQMLNIVRTLARTPDNFCCPHGRPTTWQVPRDMITKKFKRDYRQQEKY